MARIRPIFYITLVVPIFLKGYNGMALYPFILVKRKSLCTNATFINHELIHFQQQKELLILPFYIFYLINYLWNLLRYRQHRKAYYHICFEQEAYQNEQDINYLKNRKLFAFIHYLYK
ncbi:MAG: hypothetical protein ACFB0B_22085 [Thermonemataceae bacterium]